MKRRILLLVISMSLISVPVGAADCFLPEGQLVYLQTPDCSSLPQPSLFDPDVPSIGPWDWRTADAFMLFTEPDGPIQWVSWWGAYDNGGYPALPIDFFRILFYLDDGACHPTEPAELSYVYETIVPLAECHETPDCMPELDRFEYCAQIPPFEVMDSVVYWVVIQAVMEWDFSSPSWHWICADTGTTCDAQQYHNVSGPAWSPSTCFDHAFGLYTACVNDGDLDDSGVLEWFDTSLSFEITLRTYFPNAFEACAADCNGDGMVTAGDSRGILDGSMGGAGCVDPVLVRGGGRGTDLIWVEDFIGASGEEVVAEVHLSNEDTPVESYTVNVDYDTSMLTFVGYSPGDLNTAWVLEGANEEPSGQVVAAAFSLGTPVPAGSDGVLIRLRFDVTCPTCTGGETSNVTFSAQYDDVETFLNNPGIFTFQGSAVPTVGWVGLLLLAMGFSALLLRRR